MFARLVVVLSVVASVAAETLRTEVDASSTLVSKERFEKRQARMAKRMADMRDSMSSAPAVTSDSHMELDAAVASWVYINAYSSGTTCSGNVIQQGGYSGCSYGTIMTCSGTTVTENYYGADDCSGAITDTDTYSTTDCAINPFMYYNSAAVYYQYSCPSATATVATATATPNVVVSSYTTAGCDSSTQFATASYMQSQCFGFADATSMMIVSPNVNSYAGIACAGAITSTETKAIATCAINEDDSTEYVTYAANSNGASHVVGASLITAFVAIAAGIMSIM